MNQFLCYLWIGCSKGRSNLKIKKYKISTPGYNVDSKFKTKINKTKTVSTKVKSSSSSESDDKMSGSKHFILFQLYCRTCTYPIKTFFSVYLYIILIHNKFVYWYYMLTVFSIWLIIYDKDLALRRHNTHTFVVYVLKVRNSKFMLSRSC